MCINFSPVTRKTASSAVPRFDGHSRKAAARLSRLLDGRLGSLSPHDLAFVLELYAKRMGAGGVARLDELLTGDVRSGV